MLRDFFGWWLGPLAKLLPRPMRRLHRVAEAALAITRIGPVRRVIAGTAVSLRRHRQEAPIGEFALASARLVAGGAADPEFRNPASAAPPIRRPADMIQLTIAAEVAP